MKNFKSESKEIKKTTTKLQLQQKINTTGREEMWIPRDQ